MADRFQAVANSFSQERLGNERQYGQQLSFALGRGNTDAAQSLIQERLDAATASGDERGAAAYQSQLKMLETSPEALLTETLMPLVSTMPVDDFDKFYELAVGGGEADGVLTLVSEGGHHGLPQADLARQAAPPRQGGTADGAVLSIGGAAREADRGAGDETVTVLR